MKRSGLICAGLMGMLLVICGGCNPNESSIASQVAQSEGDTVVFIKATTDSGENIGSGIIVEAMGRIITCQHIIKDIREGWVKPPGGQWIPITSIVAEDVFKDLAVIDVDPRDQFLQVARIGSVMNVNQGDPVVAIGNPLGEENAVSDGIVSAIRREEGYPVIQHTAPVSPGSSGGPLFDQDGMVIGITSFLRQNPEKTAQNLNYSVAVDEALPLIGSIEVKQNVSPGYRPPGSSYSVMAYISLPRLICIGLVTLLIYLLTTFIIFPALINNPRLHPSNAFGICSIFTWGTFTILSAILLSGFFDWAMGWRSWFVGWLFIVCLAFGIVLAVVILLLIRPKATRENA